MTEPHAGGRTRRGMWPTVLLGLLLAVAAVAVAVRFEGAARHTPACDQVQATPGFPGGSGAESCRLPAGEWALLDGSGTLNPRSLHGKPAVINFWATWCEPCVRELPLLAQAAADLDGQVAFVGIDVQDRREPALQLARRSNVAYPLVADPRGELYQALRGSGMPTTLLIDAGGTVVYRRTGEVSRESLAALLREHLAVIWDGASAR